MTQILCAMKQVKLVKSGRGWRKLCQYEVAQFPYRANGEKMKTKANDTKAKPFKTKLTALEGRAGALA